MTDHQDTTFSFLEPLPTRIKKGDDPSNIIRPHFQGYVLALEGGGTRSQAALMDTEGRVVQSAQSSDVNIHFTTFEQAQQVVQTIVRDLLQSADVAGEEVSLCVPALVGPRFGAETYAALLPNAIFHYYNEIDVVFARTGIFEPNGVAVVAGTGATAAGIRKEDGQTLVVGGWGTLLGDEGSGYAMGLLGLRAAVRAFEGRLPAPTGLVGSICQHFDLKEANFRHELIHLAYQKPLSRTEIAGIASIVTQSAAQKDPAAVQIVQKVSSDLAVLALHAVRHLFEPSDSFDLVAAGGLTRAGDLVIAPLQTGLAQEFPRSNFHIGVEEPAAALGRLALYHLSNR